jgi:hypothetical protein
VISRVGHIVLMIAAVSVSLDCASLHLLRSFKVVTIYAAISRISTALNTMPSDMIGTIATDVAPYDGLLFYDIVWSYL